MQVGEVQRHTRVDLNVLEGSEARRGEVALERGDFVGTHIGVIRATGYRINGGELRIVTDQIVHLDIALGNVGRKEAIHIIVMVTVRVRDKPRRNVDGIGGTGRRAGCSCMKLGQRGVQDLLVLVFRHVVATVHDHKATILQQKDVAHTN